MSAAPATVQVPHAVAVTGMACRLPGAADVSEYWDLLRGGVEGITRFDVADLIARGADPGLVLRDDFVPAKGVVANSRDFDWRFFRYNRADAANIDPQQRVFLECAAAAIDDAGLDPARFDGRIGVYAGSDRTPLDDSGELTPLVRVVSHEKDFLATRVAYKLGLRGPAVTVQTACSTSLTAIHLATQALLTGECDAVLAGGVAVSPSGEWGYLHEPGSVLSPDGHCRPFDAAAAGTVPSEGVGVVVLRRLADALRDGDQVLAVVAGSALNNDGSDKLGFTAPSIPGQSEVIRHAHKASGVRAAEIDYVECHGTATPMGDPVEVAALTEAFGDVRERDGAVWLGAVKGNLGHTSAAAGVAGFIKTVLMLHHRELVPTVHYMSPNPLLELESSPFDVCTEHRPWPDCPVPTAAVSAFGVGGTNAHVIMQAAPERTTASPPPGPSALLVTAATREALGQLSADLARRLESDDTLSLASVARTLAGRRRHARRRVVVATDRAEAVESLRAPVRSAPARLPGKIAFLLPGHGVLRDGAGVAAYRLLPDFREHFDNVARFVREECGLDLTPLVIEPPAEPRWERPDQPVDEDPVAGDFVAHQVGLYALGYALGRQLGAWGLAPAALLGNSVGEYAAAALAGVWSPTDGAALVRERARAMEATGPGRMVAVNATAEQVAQRVPLGGDIAVAMVGRGGVVLSGRADAIDSLLASDALDGLDLRVLNVSRAAHCEVMAPAAGRLTELVATMVTHRASVPLVSNTTGGWADPDAVREPGYWAAQVRGTVLLDDGMRTLLESDCRTFVELGPGASMLGALRLCDGWGDEHAGVPLLGRAEDGEPGVLRALGTLWELGADTVEGVLVPAGERPVRCSLPPHPLARQNPEAELPVVTRASAVERDPLRGRLERMWCQALGVAAANDEDNFLDLGGESLTALQLMRQVRDRLGIAVPVAEFLRDPTFGRLLAARCHDAGTTTPGAAAPSPAAPPAGAVLLREGAGRPVFLVADSTESAASYLDLAAQLDVGRPVIGLEPPAGSSSRTPVAEVAARHVEAMRECQPAGPYTIGGWSFGAVVAHEMAARLPAAGERADLLICLDAYVPGRVGGRVGADLPWVAGHLRLLTEAVLGVGAAGAQARRNPALRGLLVDKFLVLARHRVRHVDCPTVVCKAGLTAAGARRLGKDLRRLYPAGPAVRPVPGDHWSMLRAPHVTGLAAVLREELAPERIEDEHHG